MNEPRKIKRHAFLYRNSTNLELNEFCALASCRLPYESEVHWILDEGTDVQSMEEEEAPVSEHYTEKKLEGPGPHEFVLDWNGRCATCKMMEGDPAHKVEFFAAGEREADVATLIRWAHRYIRNSLGTCIECYAPENSYHLETCVGKQLLTRLVR